MLSPLALSHRADDDPALKSYAPARRREARPPSQAPTADGPRFAKGERVLVLRSDGSWVPAVVLKYDAAEQECPYTVRYSGSTQGKVCGEEALRPMEAHEEQAGAAGGAGPAASSTASTTQRL